MPKLSMSDLKPVLIVWNDAYQDAQFDGPLEEVPVDDHLQQTTVGFLIKSDKKGVKFCNELCEQTGHVRNIVAVPRRYVVSVTPLSVILPPAAEPPTKE
jgi:hypothetical protein